MNKVRSLLVAVAAIGSAIVSSGATLVRDTTGIWLKVSNPGLQLFIR